LIDKIADKSFSTPTALGQYLNDIYNSTIEEFTESKAKMVKELEGIFKKQIEGLTLQIKDLHKLTEDKDKVIHEKTGLLEVSSRTMARLEASLSKQSGTSTKTILAWVALGVVIGLILMALMK
jgi:hypothetical protein